MIQFKSEKDEVKGVWRKLCEGELHIFYWSDAARFEDVFMLLRPK